MRFRLTLAALLLAVVGIAATAAAGAPAGAGSCAGGLIAGGTYNGFTVTGTCFFAGAPVTINGNLIVAPGASLNAHAATFAVVHVSGNVIVGAGAILGLGMFGGPTIPQTGTVVDGNVVADRPQSLYLSAMTIHGSLVSNGGSGPGLNFPLKNLIVGGNVVLQGWTGLWIGMFRSQVGGNVVFSRNSGNQIGENGLPDSSELADNVIAGSLICLGNDPGAQIGDSGGGLNTVGGVAVGQCSSLKR
jgi:hypothetical protein